MKRVLLGIVFTILAAMTTTTTANAYARTEVCEASWYGEDFHMKNPMANGKLFNMYDPKLVAHKELPLGTRIRITNLSNGRTLTATVTDRGPYKPGRCVDVSMAGSEILGFKDDGVTDVKVEVVS